MRIDIKPLSVNQCWQGKRFKTIEYLKYEKDCLYLLPKLDVPKGIQIELILNIGLSNPLADIDNIAKPFIDILQKKYGFNDSQIYVLYMQKVIVPKGYEHIVFKINEI